MGSITEFMEKHFRHFNAREALDAAKAWRRLLDDGGQMLLAMAGALSTGEIGISLAEMIRGGRVHAISCTAANLEEDVFNLFAHRDYRMVPNYRDLSPEDERELRDAGLNRVTDTCIPESVMRHTEKRLFEMWREGASSGSPRFPWEYLYELLADPSLGEHFEIPAKHSWVLAAMEAGIPVYTPGWEDSTLGNIYTSCVMNGKIAGHGAIRTGTEQLEHLANWYLDRVERKVPVGFFQIGGGIPGDFAICAVPSGRTSHRSATARRPTDPTPERCPTRRSPGTSSTSTPRSS
jgi:deoxyhypusine synthase